MQESVGRDADALAIESTSSLACFQTLAVISVQSESCLLIRPFVGNSQLRKVTNTWVSNSPNPSKLLLMEEIRLTS